MVSGIGRSCAIISAFALGMGGGIAHGQEQFAFETSPYWCDKLGGTMSGDTCTAPYVADSDACGKFERLNPDDAALRQSLEQIRQASICLSDTVASAKANSLRLRADLMGYVSAGNDETVNDPTSTRSGDIVDRANRGAAPYWPLVSYYLHQCVVETCEAK
jgi:hypothetical protein